MITDEGKVRFLQHDPVYGGDQLMELEEDLFLVLVRQARSLEELRVLWFSWAEHKQNAQALRSLVWLHKKPKATRGRGKEKSIGAVAGGG